MVYFHNIHTWCITELSHPGPGNTQQPVHHSDAGRSAGWRARGTATHNGAQGNTQSSTAKRAPAHHTRPHK